MIPVFIPSVAMEANDSVSIAIRCGIEHFLINFGTSLETTYFPWQWDNERMSVTEQFDIYDEWMADCSYTMEVDAERAYFSGGGRY